MWKDLSEAQLIKILEPKETLEVRRNVQDALNIVDDGDDIGEILIDLYYNAIAFAQEQKFTMEKISTLVSIVKAVHTQSTVGRLAMDKSWEKTKQILLTHSVQRPPFSVSVFSLADLQAITHYLLHTYFRHYKMYQYACMPTFVLNIATLELSNFVQTSPIVPPLQEFMNQEEYDIEQALIQKQKEEEEAKQLEEKRLAAEAARQHEIELAYLAAVPDEITVKVLAALQKHLGQMRIELEDQIHLTEEKVIQKLSTWDESHPSKMDEQQQPSKMKPA
ncbi:unnamed protein product [Sphagnum troendelagicum]|uniref:Uncharacterized protein n=1 Tax=Sphagnum troendelagicum TaxID=128251 RepID=A0ABP0UZQ4_9BRYO